jgi:hypothetical protein
MTISGRTGADSIGRAVHSRELRGVSASLARRIGGVHQLASQWDVTRTSAGAAAAAPFCFDLAGPTARGNRQVVQQVFERTVVLVRTALDRAFVLLPFRSVGRTGPAQELVHADSSVGVRGHQRSQQ